MILLPRSSSARYVPFARYSVCAALSPVWPSGKPILIVSAAAALLMNGLASGAAAIAAAPSSARRRGTTSPEFLAVIDPPSPCHPVRVRHNCHGVRPLTLTALGKQPGQPRVRMALRLRRHPHRGIDRAILLIAAGSLDNLEEEPVIERIRIGVQEFTMLVTVIKQVERSEHFDPIVIEAPFGRHVLVVVGRYRQEMRAARDQTLERLNDV